jgi:hypothetical protein
LSKNQAAAAVFANNIRSFFMRACKKADFTSMICQITKTNYGLEDCRASFRADFFYNQIK